MVRALKAVGGSGVGTAPAEAKAYLRGSAAGAVDIFMDPERVS